MAILGLLLLAAATAVGIEFAISNTATTGFEIFGNPYVASLGTIALLGAAVGAVAALGVWMMWSSFRRRQVRRTATKHRVRIDDLKTRVAELEQVNADLVAETDRLRAELTAHELAEATLGGVAVPPGVGDVPYGDQVTDAMHKEVVDLTENGRPEPYPTERAGGRHEHDHAMEGEQKAGVVGRFRGTP
jgi:uncharacterized integral membrane protein